ncbi:MAG: alpha/beta fold hydrolase [Rhodothermales bacterium]
MPFSSDGHAADDVFERRFLKSAGHRISLAVADPPVATTVPVVAIHGFGTSGYRTYRHIARQLFDAGVPLYAPDLPGFGESDAPDVEYSLHYYARSVARLCNELGLHRPIIIGHSMGGKVAAATAVLYEDELSGLGLINSGGFSPAERVLPFIAGSSTFHSLLRQDWFYHGIVPRTPLAPILQTEDNRLQLERLRYSHHRLDLRRAGLQRRLLTLRLPTLILWGEHDRLLPRRTPLVIQKYLRHAHLRFVRGAGHAPMKDQPDAVAREIILFTHH